VAAAAGARTCPAVAAAPAALNLCTAATAAAGQKVSYCCLVSDLLQAHHVVCIQGVRAYAYAAACLGCRKGVLHMVVVTWEGHGQVWLVGSVQMHAGVSAAADLCSHVEGRD
jgi:hypothetical protein